MYTAPYFRGESASYEEQKVDDTLELTLLLFSDEAKMIKLNIFRQENLYNGLMV